MSQPAATPHTPGPWTAGTPNISDYIDIDAGCQRITSICLDTSSIAFNTADPNDTPENEIAERWANARLIAAAPAMLDALAYVVNWHRGHDSGEGELFGLDYVTTCLSVLRAADPDWHTTPEDREQAASDSHTSTERAQ